MNFINTHVEIDGIRAELAWINANSAGIVLLNHGYETGAECACTIFANLLGKQVPIKMKAEVVQPYDASLEVMFSCPTQNWQRLFQFMSHRIPVLP